jgi:hypothetical protein
MLIYMIQVLMIIRQDDKHLEHETCLRRAGLYKIYTERT